MSDAVQHVIDDSEQLQQLRARLSAIDAERAQIQAQIDAAMQRIAAVVVREVPPAAHMPLTHHILWVLRSNRTFALSPTDVAQRLGMTRRSELENIRVHLSRMRQKGWIKRVGHGRYQAHNE
ncbi:MAG TPA: type IV toxin-antitoxin system AbiEi family antitoxin domain-containing protein [Thermoanaerobaculia bacterium]|nr:type IV toxin-antitoxin system AbiEi family antitoxin domain-containing protein [Thermoanaerobaculia bacterium]